jgi:uncharacterized protein YkwD
MLDASSKALCSAGLRERAFVNLVFVLVSTITALTMPFQAPAPAQRSYDPAPAIRARLINQINAHRRSFGLPPLTLDPLAQRAAQFQASDMEANAVMRHQDSDGRTPLKRYAAFGGRASLYGENVAYYGDPNTESAAIWQAVSRLDQMMMGEQPPSDGHRENILSPNYRAIGIGVAVGANGVYIAEDFVLPE